MTEQKNKCDSKIIFICWLAYTAAYVGRLNFNASIVAIVDSLGTTKAAVGLVGSFFFFAYGVGQLVNGILTKHYNSKIMVFISLTASAFLNVLIPVCDSVESMKYIWLLNGAVQSVLWCTLIKTISEKVSDKNMPKAIIAMSSTTPVGTLIAYGLSALFIKFSTWKAIFFVASAVLLTAAVVWLLLFGKSEKVTVAIEKKSEKLKLNKAVILALVITAFAGIANGFVKDGVTTWVSSLLYEEFDVSQSFSVMLTLLLPLVATLAATVVKKIHEKIKSHTAMNTLFFSVSAVLCGGILLSLKNHSFIVIMICFMGIAFCMAMANNVITSVFPLDYRKLLGAGFIAGLLNTFCYVGSTVTSYSLGSVAQEYGWNVTFVIMLAVCAVASVVSLAGCISEKSKK